MVAFELFFGDVLAADAGGHPRAESGSRNGKMANAEAAVGVVDGADAELLQIQFVRAFFKAIFVFANVEQVLVNN